MQKIMFNNRYGLTQAVIEGRKSVTRRIEGGARFQEMVDCADEIFYNEDDGTLDMRYEGIDIFSHKCRYKVGEVVAVAQSYEQVYHQEGLETMEILVSGMKTSSGWKNKMFVRADLMPHQIRITGIRCERLQDISNADCLKEGIMRKPAELTQAYPFYHCNNECHYDTAVSAFVSLIDKVSGRGTWQRNLWVVVYEFELIK